jgi:hypothetical protein
LFVDPHQIFTVTSFESQYVSRQLNLNLVRMRGYVMRSKYVLVLCVLLIGVSTRLPVTAQTTSQNQHDVGFVRFAHVAIDVPAIDIYQIDGLQPLVSKLEYGKFTDFIALPTTSRGYIARTAGSETSTDPLFRLQWGVTANKSELVLAAGSNAQKSFLLEPITLLRSNTQGKARVRVVNAAWGGTPLTLKTNQDVLAQSLAYAAVADADIKPDTYDFDISTDAGQSVGSEKQVMLEADKVYTMVITGSSQGQPPIQLMTVVSDQETTRVKFINQNGAPADIYLKGSDKALATGLGTNATSEFITIPSGAATFIIRNVGSAATERELGALMTQLRPGRDVIISLVGGNPPKLEITEEILTVPGPVAGTHAATSAAPQQSGSAAAATSEAPTPAK